MLRTQHTINCFGEMKNVKPYRSNKGSNKTKMVLVEKGMIITDEKQVIKYYE